MLRPHVELIRGSDGAWNFSSIGTHNQQQSKEQQQAGQTKPLQLDSFQIVDGAVAITDQQRNQPRMEYNHIDLVLKDYAPGKPFEIALNAAPSRRRQAGGKAGWNRWADRRCHHGEHSVRREPCNWTRFC